MKGEIIKEKGFFGSPKHLERDCKVWWVCNEFGWTNDLCFLVHTSFLPLADESLKLVWINARLISQCHYHNKKRENNSAREFSCHERWTHVTMTNENILCDSMIIAYNTHALTFKSWSTEGYPLFPAALRAGWASKSMSEPISERASKRASEKASELMDD